jgi:predicted ATP-grasp superfamily ATP-dependent carboligase
MDIGDKYKLNDWILFPTNDHIVKNIIDNRQIIEKRYKYFGPDVDTFYKIYQKKELIKLALNHQIPVPDTYLTLENLNASDFNLNFPVLLRGNTGLSFYRQFKKKAFLAKTDDELNRILELIINAGQIPNSFIQELIPQYENNKTLSFSAICIEGEVFAFWMGEKIRDHPPHFGTATVAKSIFQEEIYSTSVQLLKHLRYTGACEIEFIYHPVKDKFVLIEINPRTWLWVGLADYCGVDFPLLIYNYLQNNNNLSVKRELQNYQSDIAWIHLYTDLYFSLKQIAKGKLSIRDFIRPYQMKKTFAVLSKEDILPFIMETILLPILAARR